MRNIEIVADRLLDHARHWLVHQGHADLPSAIFMVFPAGGDVPEIFPLLTSRRPDDEHGWVNFCRLAIAVLEPECYAVSFPAWMRRVSLVAGSPLPRTYADVGGRPSEHADRVDTVVVVARSVENGRAVRMVEIVRGPDDKAIELKPLPTAGMLADGMWDHLFDVPPVIREAAAMACSVASDNADRIALVMGYYDRVLQTMVGETS